MVSTRGAGPPGIVEGRRRLGPPPDQTTRPASVAITDVPEPRATTLVTPPDRSEPVVSSSSVGRPKRAQAKPVDYARVVDGPDYDFCHDVSHLRITLSPYGNLGVAGFGGLAQLFDPKSGELGHSLVSFQGQRSRMEFHPDGNHFAIELALEKVVSNSSNRPTVMYAADTGRPVDTFWHRFDYPLDKHEKLRASSQPDLSHVKSLFYQDAEYGIAGSPSEGYQLHHKDGTITDLKLNPFEPVVADSQNKSGKHAVTASGRRLAFATKTPDKSYDSVLLTDGEGTEVGRHRGKLLSFSQDERALFLLKDNGVRVVSAETGSELVIIDAPDGMKMERAQASHDGHIILMTLLDEAQAKGLGGPTLDAFPRTFKTFSFEGA